MNTPSKNLRVAFYARVSSDRQADANTIDSQIAALKERITQDGCQLDDNAGYIDNGVSGTTLIRPALEKLRDYIAQGIIDRLYLQAPDRLARKAAYQALLIDEFTRAGVELVFLNHKLGKTPEDELLLQVQAIISEYERAKILERSRRGKLHAARRGSVNALSGAPFGYRYISVADGGGEARYQIILEEAKIVQQIFSWIGLEHLSIQEVCRRLEKSKVKTRTGKSRWDPATVSYILKNPAYQGEAGYGKSRTEAPRPSHRPRRGQSEHKRPTFSVTRVNTEPILIAVPAIVSKELYAAVKVQVEENRRRYRLPRSGESRVLLQGLVVCPVCGYAWCGQARYNKGKGKKKDYVQKGTYRCAGRMMGKKRVTTICHCKPIRISELDEAVWKDVCALLREPKRIEAEYERRLQGEEAKSPNLRSMQARISQLKRGISRLIDAYSEGMLEKEEFEKKIRPMKERLEQLQAEAKEVESEEMQRNELRLVIGKLEEFTERMNEGLEQANWKSRREIIRALVKQVEVNDEHIRIVYRVNIDPFSKHSNSSAQDCCKGAPPSLFATQTLTALS